MNISTSSESVASIASIGEVASERSVSRSGGSDWRCQRVRGEDVSASLSSSTSHASGSAHSEMRHLVTNLFDN